MKTKVKKAKSSYDLEYLPPKLDFIASTRKELATFRSKQRIFNFTNQFTFGWDSSCSSDSEDNEPTKLSKRYDVKVFSLFLSAFITFFKTSITTHFNSTAFKFHIKKCFISYISCSSEKGIGDKSLF